MCWWLLTKYQVPFYLGMPITLVPLDVTYQCILMQADVDRLLKIDSPITRFIADSSKFYMEFHDEYQSIEGCVINDPLALALAFMPELVETKPLYVTVDIHSELGLGNTIADFYNAWCKPPNMQAALTVQVRRFIDLFAERMERLAISKK